MKRIASKITENGIDKYLPEEPAENGNRNLDQNRSDLHTIDVDKESQALCARFADRYAEIPQFDSTKLKFNTASDRQQQQARSRSPNAKDADKATARNSVVEG
ncbi:hypothetical protein pipiens_016906 [Culex pipiens pipiens]|uniref:Uncharacterized protein n=1 Tax=Culex pipiens pipiens TaxID=38569 RepID=A0ABD1CJ94_CULPP